MPEIKHQFTRGKMNKDLDERLIPKGEYRDAMNIQVSTSEGSDVGTVQNILGNSEIYGTGVISSSAICVGAIADEKNDKLYWFIKDSGATIPFDGIFEYSSANGVAPVLIDTNLNVLNFQEDKIITGINIIDDMLFWTDNVNEPKKINIKRSKEGTTSVQIHTYFVNYETGVNNIQIREEHITVIKKGPTTPPVVKLISERSNDESKIYTGVMRITSEPIGQNGGTNPATGLPYPQGTFPTPLLGYGFNQQIGLSWNNFNLSSMWMSQSVYNHHHDFSELSVGDYFDTQIETDIFGESGFTLDWEIGDTLLFQAYTGDNYDIPPQLPLRNYSVKARIRHVERYVRDYFYLPLNLFDNAGLDEPFDANYNSSSIPLTLSETWEQGVGDTNIIFWGQSGFDGKIGEMHIYEIDPSTGLPDTTGGPWGNGDLCTNPYFNLTDSAGNSLPKWRNTGDCCLEHGPGTPIGQQYSTNTTLIAANGGIAPAIDPVAFPCYPSHYCYSLYPKSNDWQNIINDYGPWHIDHQNAYAGTPNGGFMHHGGRGFNGIQDNATGNPDMHGGMIQKTNGDHMKMGRAAGSTGAPGAPGGNGYYNWAYYANNLPTNDSSFGNTINNITHNNAYEVINQNGPITLSMLNSRCQQPSTTNIDPNYTGTAGAHLSYDDGVGCFGRGRKYKIEYTMLDTGHTWPRLNDWDNNTNGSLQFTGSGMVDPWQKPNYFTDQPAEMIKNGDFREPDANGDRPRYWTQAGNGSNGDLASGNPTWSYNPSQHYVECGRVISNANNPNAAPGERIRFHYGTKVNISIKSWMEIELHTTYDISFELSHIDTVLSEGVELRITGANYTLHTWKTPMVNTNGVHNFQITTDPATAFTAGLNSGHRIYFRSTYSPTSEGFIGRILNVSVKRKDPPNANVTCEVLAIHNPPTAPDGGEIKFAVDLESIENKLFEFQFPRFAYRYQYGDNEYSPMSPFSPVAFIPGGFRYHPKEGFNLAMSNRMVEATIKGFMDRVPDGVIAIDILFKDDKSPDVYIVDTIKPKHIGLISNSNEDIWTVLQEYTITSEQIKSMITPNQLLRPWDAVPLKALAQDVSGSRIVYGNYVQSFDLKYENPDEDTDPITGQTSYLKYYPDFNFDILSSDNFGLITEKSVKSLREYQLGVVFADHYGRETPIMSNFTGTKALKKEEGRKINQLQVGFNDVHFPKDMKYFKFFIKETSNEYYNLAMDRWYDAEDGGAWLAFPSTDRNKVDIDTFLILKKPQDSSVAVIDETRYKILDIQDNVPPFVKQNRQLISSNIHDFIDTSNPSIFGTDLSDAPLVGESSFKMNYKPYFNTSASDLHKINTGDLYIDFETTTGNITERYRISKITCDYEDFSGGDGEPVEDAQYSIVLDGGFGDDVNLITDDPLTGLTPTKILDGTTVNIYRYKEENLARFDGRFFAKINIDADFNQALLAPEGKLKYRRIESKKLYYLSNDADLYSTALTGHNALSDMDSIYNTDFSKFASFFRNYNRPPSHINIPLLTDGSEDRNIGAFAFGDDSDDYRPWLRELAWIGIDPAHSSSCPIGVQRQNEITGSGPNAGTAGSGQDWPGVKIADNHGWDNKQRINGVFNARGEQEQGDVWFIDGGDYFTEVSESSKLKWTEEDPMGTLENTRLINSNTGVGQGIEETTLSNGTGNELTFEIGIGGIYNKETQFTTNSGETPLDNFWNIGTEEHSAANDDTHIELSGMLNQLAPGRKFRFREDPTGEVYTIQEDVREINRIRWNTIDIKPTYSPSGVGGTQYSCSLRDYGWYWESVRDVAMLQSFPFGSHEYLSWRVNAGGAPNCGSSGYFPLNASVEHPDPSTVPGNSNEDFKDNEDGICTSNSYAIFSRFAKQLSPNFSKTWKPKVLNSEGNPTISWNPIGSLGPIANGLELEIVHSGEAAVNIDPNVYVNVNSLEATDVNTGAKHNITVGMIMVSHSDAATDCVFDGDDGTEYLAIKEIKAIGGGLGVGLQATSTEVDRYELHLTGYSKVLVNNSANAIGITKHQVFTDRPGINKKMVFAQPTMNGYSQYSVNRINAQNAVGMGWTGPELDASGKQIGIGNPGIMAVGYNLDFVEQIDLDANLESVVSENPAVWETEPKEAIDLDLYYEASGYYPLRPNGDTATMLLPIGSTVETVTGVWIEQGTTIQNTTVDASGDIRITLTSPSDGDFTDPAWDPSATPYAAFGTLVEGSYINIGQRLKITKPNGNIVLVTITGFGAIDANGRTTEFIVSQQVYGPDTSYILNWHNCYSFGNGVESNRIRDNFNLPFISNGVKVSTTWDGDYNREHRKYGLIYSGLYNSNSGVNNLNQFIAAEKITKDINPIYGSIQKLHSRDSDLVTLCEDKCLKILANKDAVFNADGNPNLTATANVLGQTIPFNGEYGISKNPESFASEAYRAYFTDKVRGVVMRLSVDGLTPISMHGMKDWFKDNLKLSNKLIGSYDDKKEEYNITLDNSTNGLPKTVSFKEDVKGWVSFKSFIPEFGISMANNYYTMKLGYLYEHHQEISNNRNTFYGDYTNSSVDVILNDGPDSIKSFHTLNYEGSQSKIDQVINSTELEFDFQPTTHYNDQEYYNLSTKAGWFVQQVGGITTDQDTGYTTNFVEKEGKWFANMNKFIDITL